ncbi:tRNA (adenosine(37)-N6)-threonylcarbamoyltransferase complex dimerization subunit type 1 TsaB [soil metagenome]
MPASQRPATLLAIECSTSCASVALFRAGLEPVVETGAGGAAVSSGLLPMIERLLERCAVGRSAIDAIAFGAGPGSFMGVRTAAAVAQGLAVVRDLPVQPVGTLAALAWRAARRGARQGRYAVVVDARMDEVYHAVHELTDLGWLTLAPPAVDQPAVALDHWRDAGLDAATTVVGAPGLLALEESQRRLDASIDAVMIGEAALDHWIGGAAALALPVYVRDRFAATLSERALAKAA